MDDRRRTPSDGKSSHCLWQGELKMGKYGKSKLKNIVKYNLLGLLVFHVTILWLTDFR